MHIRLDDDVHTANSVQFDLFILVVPPIAHGDKVFATSVEFLVALGDNSVLVQRRTKFQSLFRLLPGIVVDCWRTDTD